MNTRFGMLVLGALSIAASPLSVPASNADPNSLDEKAVTARARAFGPKDDGGQRIDGIPVSQIRWLLDREQILDCITRYTRGLDRHDAQLLASAFWPDAQISYGGMFTSPRDEFTRYALDDDGKRFAAHLHNITQQTVEIQGDTAHAESYVLAFEQHPDSTAQLAGGRYIDRLEKRHGEWRIVLREFVLDTKAKVDGSFFLPGKTCQPICGTWDHTDLSYERPLRARGKLVPPPAPGTPPPDATHPPTQR
jgi:ketosteroid isomerase-like protein